MSSSKEGEGKDGEPTSTELTQAPGGKVRDGYHSFVWHNNVFTIEKRYQPIKALGRGSSGVVVCALDKQTDRKVAVKKIPNIFEDIDRAKRCLREVRLLRLCRHSHVIALLDLVEPPSKEEFDDLYLVLEYMETDLYKTIYSANKLSDEHLQYFIYQILCALQYIHSAGVIHRDLKPSNVLLNGDCRAKLCDFGLARCLPEKESSKLTEYVVTRWYRAPEVICSDGYDEKIDVWAVGCILAELLGRKPLFRGHDYVEQINLILDHLGTPAEEDLKFVTNNDALEYLKSLKPREAIPFSRLYPNANPLALDLLEQMLQFNPAKRCTVQQALRHPYLKRYQSEPPTCPHVVDFSYEKDNLTKDMLRELFWQEVQAIKAEQKNRPSKPRSGSTATSSSSAGATGPQDTQAAAMDLATPSGPTQ